MALSNSCEMQCKQSSKTIMMKNFIFVLPPHLLRAISNVISFLSKLGIYIESQFFTDSLRSELQDNVEQLVEDKVLIR